MSWANKKTFKRILVANRGEIACRVIRTARKMGLETVAVYSDADNNAVHTRLADRSVYIGAAAPQESYLNISGILSAAKACSVDMIHPGYGFLSENSEFAKACADNGIQFIGPPPKAISEMGSKSRAKLIMAEAEVPLVPGYHGNDQSDPCLIKAAETIGFPLLIKAVSGGGGKGMRIVDSADELESAIASARRESLKAFGDDQLLLEAYLPTPRHVEVQIFFDQQGQGVYLFDRDCSLQRRYQKVIEEAPAPGLSDELRTAMGKAALEAGKAIGYEGAGTVEFLLNGEDFYFMEINTRLQVEHPVTERITGVDLVEWQIRVAAGESLPLKQSELGCHGHAMEARVYAEDPANNFLPSAGRIACLEWPEQDGFVRIDSGVQQGDLVSSWYDPMLAKVIVWGENRSKAIDTLTQSLSSSYQAGVTDNRDYLIFLLSLRDFRNGAIDTSLAEQNVHQLTLLQKRKLLVVAALYQYRIKSHEAPTGNFSSFVTASPFFFYHQEQELSVSVEKKDQLYFLTFADGACKAKASWQQEPVGLSGRLSIEGEIAQCRVIPMPGQKIKVFLPDCSLELGLPGYQQQANERKADSLSAPMNGTVTTIAVKQGQSVVAGETLLTMEAMKMEHMVKAPRDGLIADVFFKAGDQVTLGTPLMAYQDEAHVAT
ncbi:biotin/lipoyl-binding protein [Endozoicomonas sp. Mp262]|uniref:ATP-binding protein n=1 Tax=Endozoicomonas sp. Mp262 TaxID=2919499 RepID=UPI0021E0F93F